MSTTELKPELEQLEINAVENGYIVSDRGAGSVAMIGRIWIAHSPRDLGSLIEKIIADRTK